MSILISLIFVFLLTPVIVLIAINSGLLDYTKFTHMDVSRVRIACPNCGMELNWWYQRLSFDHVRFSIETPCPHCRYRGFTAREIEREVEYAEKASRIQWFKKETPSKRHVTIGDPE